MGILSDTSYKIGELKDKLDNLLGAMELPMPAEFHLKQMKSQIKDISEELKQMYILLEDDNPWQDD